jgi:hypothetical protein
VPPVTRTNFPAIKAASAIAHFYSGDLRRQSRTRPASNSS